jgi:hypothetical protein
MQQHVSVVQAYVPCFIEVSGKALYITPSVQRLDLVTALGDFVSLCPGLSRVSQVATPRMLWASATARRIARSVQIRDQD